MAAWIPMLTVAVLGALALYGVTSARQRRVRARRIEAVPLPEGVWIRVRERYPHLGPGELLRVQQGLREYFQVCNTAGRRMVSMPSRVVDVAWHELILFTRFYDRFCRRALGRFLHHTPAEAMRSPTSAQLGIRRAWRIACAREGIDPRAPERLPLLFALDAELAIPDGFVYAPDCTGRDPHTYCASGIGCAGGCAGDAGDGSGDGCGGGCGGD